MEAGQPTPELLNSSNLLDYLCNALNADRTELEKEFRKQAGTNVLIMPKFNLELTVTIQLPVVLITNESTGTIFEFRASPDQEDETKNVLSFYRSTRPESAPKKPARPSKERQIAEETAQAAQDVLFGIEDFTKATSKDLAVILSGLIGMNEQDVLAFFKREQPSLVNRTFDFKLEIRVALPLIFITNRNRSAQYEFHVIKDPSDPSKQALKFVGWKNVEIKPYIPTPPAKSRVEKTPAPKVTEATAHLVKNVLTPTLVEHAKLSELAEELSRMTEMSLEDLAPAIETIGRTCKQEFHYTIDTHDLPTVTIIREETGGGYIFFISKITEGGKTYKRLRLVRAVAKMWSKNERPRIRTLYDLPTDIPGITAHVGKVAK